MATLDTDLNARNVHFARQRAIVTRCDLRGEKHAAVAADLGVSPREFYRERRRAFERLLANLDVKPARIASAFADAADVASSSSSIASRTFA